VGEANDQAALALRVNDQRLVPMERAEWEALVSGSDVVLLGEHHNSVDDHNLELDVVRQMHRSAQSSGQPFSVGLEMVQQRFQGVLDDYVAGKIDDQGLYRGVEWSKRWSWPYEPYLPVFRFCRETGSRLVGLNTDNESLGKVERGGLEELQQEEWQRYIPDRAGFAKLGSEAEFKAYLKAVLLPSYNLHERLGILKQTVSGQVLDSPMPLKNFVSGRLLWDESMAGAAVRSVRRPQFVATASPEGGGAAAPPGPEGKVCVIVGADHVKYRYGVRVRVERLAQFMANAGAGVGSGSPLRVLSVMLNPTPADTLAPANSDLLALQLPSGASSGPVPLADMLLISTGPGAVAA